MSNAKYYERVNLEYYIRYGWKPYYNTTPQEYLGKIRFYKNLKRRKKLIDKLSRR